MLAASELQPPRSNVVRVFFLYPDFRVRVDDNSSMHYDVSARRMDSQGNQLVLYEPKVKS